MAEALNSLFKAELIRNLGPWTEIDVLEIAVAEYVDWYNHRRFHGEIGHIPPVEAESIYYAQLPAITQMERVKPSLHHTPESQDNMRQFEHEQRTPPEHQTDRLGIHLTRITPKET